MLPLPSGPKRFVLVAVILSAVGFFAVVVGSHDVFAARGLGARVFGAFLAAGGLIMLIAAAGVIRGAAWHVALSLVGSFAALLVGLALLLAQWDAGESGFMMVVWAAVVVASAIALALSLRPGAPEVSNAVRRVQLVAAAGIVVGIAQFVFTNVYGPVPAGPHVTLTSTLERGGEHDGLVAAMARIKLENTGERKVFLVDSVYRVTGQQVDREQERGRAFLSELQEAAKEERPSEYDIAAVRGVVESNATIVRAGQVLERGFWFEPGESLVREFVVHVPKENYDLLRLTAVVGIADSARLDLEDAPAYGPKVGVRTYPGGEFTVVDTRWDIRETSWVRRLIRGESVLWSRWLLARKDGSGNPLLPEMVSYVDTPGGKFDPWGTDLTRASFITDLTREYGVIATHTHAELSLFADTAEALSTP
jgi:hypothetical protein